MIRKTDVVKFFLIKKVVAHDSLALEFVVSRNKSVSCQPRKMQS